MSVESGWKQILIELSASKSYDLFEYNQKTDTN